MDNKGLTLVHTDYEFSTEVQRYSFINMKFHVNLASLLLLHLVVKVQPPGD